MRLDDRVRNAAGCRDGPSREPQAKADLKDVPSIGGGYAAHGLHHRAFPVLDDLLVADGQPKRAVVNR